MAGNGMTEFDRIGMQAQSREAFPAAVYFISQYGAAVMGKVNPELMSPAGVG